MNNEDQPSLSTQGDTNDKPGELSGTTNPSNEELQEEGGATDVIENNPDRLDNPDDLHEIQADDDLNEPDVSDDDLDESDETNEDLDDSDEMNGDELDEINETDEDENEQSANDVDGNGGYPDDAAALQND